MLAIIELIGESGAGKTTLTTTLTEELSPAGILAVDAAPDQRLTQTLAPEDPPLTLGGIFTRHRKMTGTREAIDWAFHDLVVGAGEEIDLLTVGPLPDEIGRDEEEKLRYGLTRLIDTYDYVVVDGYHPLLHRILPEESLRTVLLTTPEHLPHWQPPSPEAFRRTPALILNQYGNEALPPQLEKALLTDEVVLIGKLPRYNTPEDRIRKLPDDFRNCLLRLDIPLNLIPGP